MKRKLKSKKVFATITDLFIFSVFARVVLYGCHQIGLGMQLSLLVGLLVGGIINYVLMLNVVFLGIPLAVNLFLLVWRKDAFTLVDQLFSRVMVNQELR